MTDIAGWLASPSTWEKVAAAIGPHPYTYDLDDRSHRLDVVQIVMEAASRLVVQP
jgi:hypothetical protein